MTSEKIGPAHLSRKAIVYVRQSSALQVARNTESRKLQYAMKQRMQNLGWTEIEIVDDDLGRSANGSVKRVGFEGMIAEVCLGRVGVVAARELSRFARNSREWQQLIEVCRVVNTLLADHEAIYDARLGNDRLLLGLKGSLNEYELDLLRQRAWEARLAKAKRGDFFGSVPVGFEKTQDGRIDKSPDMRVQEAIQLVFKKFMELGSIRQTLFWFLEMELDLPSQRHGAHEWETVWKRPIYGTLHRFLTNPVYAGAYAYGRTEQVTEFRDGLTKKSIRRKPRDRWHALIPDQHQGYIAWDEFERIQEMVSDNAQKFEVSKGAPKRGAALLAGLLRCKRCGRKLMVAYTGRAGNALRYCCARGHLDVGDPRCISFGGDPVDDAVSREILRVVQPGAVEASVLAANEEARDRHDIVAALQRDLRAARYVVDRTWRQYDAADPENRLVASELEQRWNAALSHVRELETRIEDEAVRTAGTATPTIDDFQKLATQLPVVWNDPQIDVRLKKRIARLLIEEILVDLAPDEGEITALIHWKGGVHTELRVGRRKRGSNRLHSSQAAILAIRSLARICCDETIAGVLNRNGLMTGRGNRWAKERVRSARAKRKIAAFCPNRKLAEGWMNLTEAARHLDVSTCALRNAIDRTEIEAEHPLPDSPWVLQRTHLDSTQVRQSVEKIRSRNRNRPTKRADGQLTLYKSSDYPDGAV